MVCFETVCLVILLITSCRGHDVQKRGLIFPPTSLYGTFVAIAVPLDIPDKNVFVSYNFESNYAVVTNITQLDEVIFPNLPVVTARHSRSITRELAYTTLETKFQDFAASVYGKTRFRCLSLRQLICHYWQRVLSKKGHGMRGKECLLRSICEAAETPLHHNGLLGHIMHIVFTPSSSEEENLDISYYEAESDGLRGNCDKYLDLCPFSIFDLITRLVEIRH